MNGTIDRKLWIYFVKLTELILHALESALFAMFAMRFVHFLCKGGAS